jgi:hypothetical protein
MSDVHEVRVREEDLRSAMLDGDASAPSDLIVETPHNNRNAPERFNMVGWGAKVVCVW